jgi:hypothetical protein
MLKLFILLFIIGNQVKAVAQTTPVNPNWGVEPINDSIQILMLNTSWKENCPVTISNLRIVKVLHWSFEQKPKHGLLVSHKDVANEILSIFKSLYAKKTFFKSIVPMYHYHGDDNASMLDNNTSMFNCRQNAMNPKKFSTHSYGKAIDINPFQNPMVYKKDKLVKITPKDASHYQNRSLNKLGMIHFKDDVWKAFTQHNWQWGGTWRRVKDYQHFQKK